jgi:hypothetical protein
MKRQPEKNTKVVTDYNTRLDQSDFSEFFF